MIDELQLDYEMKRAALIIAQQDAEAALEGVDEAKAWLREARNKVHEASVAETLAGIAIRQHERALAKGFATAGQKERHERTVREATKRVTSKIVKKAE